MMGRFNFKNHPGTPVLIFMAILGAAAGGSRLDNEASSPWWPLWGALIMLAMFGPVYLLGAYERGRDLDA